MARINYFTVGSNKMDEAKPFYDALLASIGMKPRFEHPSGGRLYGNRDSLFGLPDSHANPTHSWVFQACDGK